jgi:two-component system phosphate regulon response regulator PhoB
MVSAKILLVDDETDMLEMMAYTLGADDHQIQTAVTGLDALNKARRFLPDLIVLDLMLDGIDGFSVCEILRAQPSTHQVPVLVITALGGQIARLNAFSVGADDFLSKPFSPQELLRRVREILATRAAQQLSDESSADTPP